MTIINNNIKSHTDCRKCSCCRRIMRLENRDWVVNCELGDSNEILLSEDGLTNFCADFKPIKLETIPPECTLIKPAMFEPEPIFTYQFSTTNKITGCLYCPFYCIEYNENVYYTHVICKGICPTKSFATAGRYYTHEWEKNLKEWFKECKLCAVQEIK